ncbi:pyruvate kinase [Alphaproteobacteria bacterium]|nr:pyruvate kinase [Alphaproteobacteria bacterium]
MSKVLVTLGPVSLNDQSIKDFARYTGLFRLNGSHGSLDWHRSAVTKIRELIPDAFILLDVPGAKPRTNNTELVTINKGDIVAFGEVESEFDGLSVKLTKPLPDLSSITLPTFSVNDGQFLFDTVQMNDAYIVGRSRGSFQLLPKKGVNLPGSVYCEKLQLKICQDFIQSANDLDVDGFGLSFIQNGGVVDALRDVAGNRVLVSKIENSEGLKNVLEIILRSDAVMIDRGDLAAEIGFDALYNAVEKITHETKANGKPLIMATENLESMSERDTPSKSEVMSLAHSVSIGADCVMLSEETAMSENGPYIVKWLSEFLEKSNITVRNTAQPKKQEKYESIWKIIGEYRHIPVLLMSKSGYALFNYMATRPDQDVTVVTDNPRLRKIAKLFSKEIFVLSSKIEEEVPIETIGNIVKENASTLFKSSDQIAAVYVSKYVTGARANCITLFDKSDFIECV